MGSMSFRQSKESGVCVLEIRSNEEIARNERNDIKKRQNRRRFLEIWPVESWTVVS
jgi:hypothetical protein